MKFNLQITGDGSAFDEDPEAEILRILRSIDPYRGGGKLYDINGNTVGSWSLEKPNLMIELYPMTKTDTLSQREIDVSHWDVLVRPDGGDPVEEHEHLSYDEAIDHIIPEMEKKYPLAHVDTQLEDLLR